MGSQYDSYSGIRIKPKDFTFLDYILDPYYWNNNVTIPAYTGEFYFDPNNPQIFKDPNGKEWVYITRNSKYAVLMGKLTSIAYMWCDGATQDDFDEKLSAGVQSEFKLVNLGRLPGSKTLQSIRDGKAVVVNILSAWGIGGGEGFDNLSNSSITFDWQNIMLPDYTGESVTKANHLNCIGPTYNETHLNLNLIAQLPTDENIFQNYDLPIWYKRENNFAQNYLGQPNFTLMQQLGSQSHNKNFMYYIANGNIQATVPLAAIPYVPAEYASSEFNFTRAPQRYRDVLKVIVSYRNASVSEATFAERFMALEMCELSGYLVASGFSVFLYDGGQLTFGMNVAMRKYPKLNGFYASIKTPSMCSTKNGLSLGGLELIVAYGTGNSFTSISGFLIQLLNTRDESRYTNCRGVVMNGLNHLEYAFGLKPKEIDGYSESNGDFCMCGLNFSICFDRTIDKRAATSTKAIGYNSQKEITKIATQGSETTAKVGSMIY